MLKDGFNRITFSLPSDEIVTLSVRMETTPWHCRCISTDKRVWLNWLYCKQAITVDQPRIPMHLLGLTCKWMTFCHMDRSVMAPCTVSVNVNEESKHWTSGIVMLGDMISCLWSSERKYFLLHCLLVPFKEATDSAILAHIPVRVLLIPKNGQHSLRQMATNSHRQICQPQFQSRDF